MDRPRLYAWASALALITIFYNVAEGLVSVFFGLRDETLALFGFGADSFVEVLSGVGIWHMLRRTGGQGAAALCGRGERPPSEGGGPLAAESTDRFEKTALKTTGVSFYILAAALLATAALDLIRGSGPETTFWGMVVSLVSIATMWALMTAKLRVGRLLGSDAILADAACTKVCLLLSFVLLASSAGFALTGWDRLDAAGAAVIAWLAYREGREAFEKAAGKKPSCGCASPC